MTHTSAEAREIQAAIVAQQGSFEIGTVLLHPPRHDEVGVRIVATGLCHTDLVVRDQVYPVPLPVVLGHEGAGVVEAVGSPVTKVVPGDHVAISFLACHECRPCLDGSPASCARFNDMNFSGQRPDGSHALTLPGDSTVMHDRFFGQSSLATHAIAHESNVVKVRQDAPLELLGPLGCGIQTGAGTVWRGLKVGPGASFVVNGQEEDAVQAIMKVVPGGVDFALDTTGIPALILQCIEALRQRGVAAILGASGPDAVLQIPANAFMQGCKTLMGVVEGNSVPDVVVPQLIDLHLQGRFPFDRLVRFYDFDQINKAAADAASGATIKPILRIG